MDVGVCVCMRVCVCLCVRFGCKIEPNFRSLIITDFSQRINAFGLFELALFAVLGMFPQHVNLGPRA